MPKIIISQLASYSPGAGYGSDIIMPIVPELSGLTRLNIYGSNYSPSDNFDVVEFIDSVGSLPAGATMGAAGLTAEKNVNIRVPLGNISETTQGTMFVLFTLGYDGGPSSSDRSDFIFSTGTYKLKASYRYVNYSNGGTDPFMRGSMGFAQITRDASNNPEIISGGLQVNSLKFGDLCMAAITKDIGNEKVTRYEMSDAGVYAKLENSVPGLAPAGAPTVSFGNANGPGPITLHAIGYYDATVLTDAQIQDLWLAMRDTVESARD